MRGKMENTSLMTRRRRRSDKKKQRCDINFVDSLPYNNISKQNKIDDLSLLLLVSGYVAHKSISHISCESK